MGRLGIWKLLTDRFGLIIGILDCKINMAQSFKKGMRPQQYSFQQPQSSSSCSILSVRDEPQLHHERFVWLEVHIRHPALYITACLLTFQVITNWQNASVLGKKQNIKDWCCSSLQCLFFFVALCIEDVWRLTFFFTQNSS